MGKRKFLKRENGILSISFSIAVLFLMPLSTSAHCDSYDGPVIKDAYKAIGLNRVEPVLKWISEEHESEIRSLFDKTMTLKNTDQQIYEIVEKYFLETLVRLHRGFEGAPYTGLKPAGSTKPIVVLADKALSDGDIGDLSTKLGNHLDKVLKVKFALVAEKSKTKEDSAEKGREYVAAYVDYTHFLEALHDVIENVPGSHQH